MLVDSGPAGSVVGALRRLAGAALVALAALAAAALAPGAAGLGPPPAGADEAETDAPPAVGAGPGGGGPWAAPDTDLAVLMGGERARGRFLCQTGTSFDRFRWSYVASAPSKYVVANCRDGWRLDRSAFHQGRNLGWDGGFFHGRVTGCGWMRRDFNVLVNSSVRTTSCFPASRATSQFASLINCPENSGCGDGTRVRTVRACTEYANIRPWSSSPSPSDPLRTRAVGDILYWRYVTHDRRWVLIHDTNPDVGGAGMGNWAFVRRECLPPDPLPAEPGFGGLYRP